MSQHFFRTVNSGYSIVKIIFLIAFVAVLVAAGAYVYEQQTNQTPSAGVSTSTPLSETPPPPPDQGQYCYVLPNAQMTVYMRPSRDADVFGTLTIQDKPTVGGKTDDGWIGFDPGVAQAPNVGPFRLRYIQPNGPYTLQGNCSYIPHVVTLQAKTCFIMTQTDTPIYAAPDTSASIIATMHYADYISAVAKKNSGKENWIKVDSKGGSITTPVTGWVDMAKGGDFNGSSCGALPTQP